MIGEEEYIKKEKPNDFRRLIGELENAIKDLFLAFSSQEKIIVQSWDEEGDAITHSTNDLYKKLGELRRNVRLEYVYPSINWLVHRLRNSNMHPGPISRTAHRKQLKYFDSMFTLSSILLLSLYSYVEMLDLWIDTYRQIRKPKSSDYQSR